MKLSITAFLLITFQLCFAQDTWINYTNNHKINDVIELDHGFWLGSDGGLCYYDTWTGEEKYYNRGNSGIPSNDIFDLLHQPNEDLWISTSMGICKFKDGEFIAGPPEITGILRENLDNKVVVAGQHNLYIQEEGMDFKVIPYPSPGVEIGGLEVDQISGAIYVNLINYYSNTYIAEWSNGEWIILKSDNYIRTAITIDHQNKLWFIGGPGLQTYENGTWKLVVDMDVKSISQDLKLFVNKDNDIIIISQVGDCPVISIWDGNALNEINFIEDGLCEEYYFIKPSERVNDHYFSSNLEKGFYSFSKDEINDYKYLSQSPLLHNNVLNTLHPSDGSHFVIFRDGVQYINSGVWTEILLPDEITGRILKGFLDPNDKLWIYDDKSLWSLENEVWTKLLPPPEMEENLWLMDIGANGDIWIQAGTIIARYKNNEWKVFTFSDHGVVSSYIYIWDLKVDPSNGDLWAPSYPGMRKYNGQSWETLDTEPLNDARRLFFDNEGAFIQGRHDIYFVKEDEVDAIQYPNNNYGNYQNYPLVMEYNPNGDILYLTGNDHLAVLQNEEWLIYNSFNSGLYAQRTNDISIDHENNIWLSGRGGGISVFNIDGITDLTGGVKKQNNAEPMIKVYPTLTAQDYLFIESEITDELQVVVSDLMDRIIYERQHQFLMNTPVEINFPSAVNNILLVTVYNSEMTFTEKIYKTER